VSTFARLHPGIQKAIYDMAWAELRPLQVRAIQATLDTDAPLILAASTASGKTEAAFLPVLSRIAEARADSVQALYISPLKALINDQFHRLEQLCEEAEIPVHRWHGDVSSTAKQRLRQEPGGVLLITPESLEAQFCHQDRHLSRMYRSLQFVVIDELHAFLDDVRGIHLRSLLARLSQQAGVKPRHIGLSATLGDFAAAKVFLHPTAPTEVQVIEDDPGGRELRLSVKSLYDSPSDTTDDGDGTPPDAGGLAAVAHDIARRFREGTNLIFCNRRHDAEVLADKLHQLTSREHWPRDPFLLHHGSLSKELREDAEARLKSGEPLTVLCTSTLEMGIDIGAAKAIGQIDPPWRVASLVQRLGRSGRRAGEPQVLRLYALDAQPTEKSSLVDRLHPDLIRAIAMVRLHLQKWLEPPTGERCHYSTCVHQILSILRQTGGTTAAVLHQRLCQHGAFRLITSKAFSTLLRGLAAHQILEQTPTGDLILAPEGEKIVESREFYAAFSTSVDFSVEHNGDKIGVMPFLSVPPVNEHFLLAGRRWKVEAIEFETRRVIVAPAKGWKRPFFSGSGGDIHPRILEEMRQVLLNGETHAYLDTQAQNRLHQAREAFRLAHLDRESVIVSGQTILWFTWAGSAICEALLLAAKADGITVTWDGVALSYERISRSDFDHHRRSLSSPDLPARIAEQLTPRELFRDRFDYLVDHELLKSAFMNERLDLPSLARLSF
jgi:ATP-dependent helicase Lhr and Lhr-like helicase